MIFLNVDNKRALSLACNLLTPHRDQEYAGVRNLLWIRIHQRHNIHTITAGNFCFIECFCRLFSHLLCNRLYNGYHVMRAIDTSHGHGRIHTDTRVEQWDRPETDVPKKMSVYTNIKISSALVLEARESKRESCHGMERDRSGRWIVSGGNYVFSRGCTAGGNGKLRKCMWRV